VTQNLQLNSSNVKLNSYKRVTRTLYIVEWSIKKDDTKMTFKVCIYEFFYYVQCSVHQQMFVYYSGHHASWIMDGFIVQYNVHGWSIAVYYFVHVSKKMDGGYFFFGAESGIC